MSQGVCDISIQSSICQSPSSHPYTAAFAFAASKIDPFTVTKGFTMDVLQYYVFGNESLINTLGRSSGILQETAICFVWQQKIYSMQAASK
jgi:hypothetical protein